MTASLFPVAMLIVFIIMGVLFCYEPEAEADPERFIHVAPKTRAQVIDGAIALELEALRHPTLANRVHARHARVNAGFF